MLNSPKIIYFEKSNRGAASKGKVRANLSDDCNDQDNLFAP